MSTCRTWYNLLPFKMRPQKIGVEYIGFYKYNGWRRIRIKVNDTFFKFPKINIRILPTQQTISEFQHFEGFFNNWICLPEFKDNYQLYFLTFLNLYCHICSHIFQFKQGFCKIGQVTNYNWTRNWNILLITTGFNQWYPRVYNEMCLNTSNY
jgi:hypothetical protein